MKKVIQEYTSYERRKELDKFVWLFPILFIFHDMEEIIGFGIWLKKNRAMLNERYPKVNEIYKDFSTEGMAAAVLEEFMVCILFCVLSIVTQTRYIWMLWLGGFIAFALHLVIHIGQSIVMKQYIPSLITSVIALPISIWVISGCVQVVNCGIGMVIAFSVLGIVIVGLNLKFAQSLIGKFTRWKEKL